MKINIFRILRDVCALAIIVKIICLPIAAQTQELPTAEKVIGNYLKAFGGKKRLSKIKDASYEWNYTIRQSSGDEIHGQAKTLVKANSMWRLDMQPEKLSSENVSLRNDNTTIATNGSSVWQRNAQGEVSTVIEAEAKAVRLQAYLAATRLTELKRGIITAKVIGTEKVQNENAYLVELTARNAASVRYYFDVNSKLLVKTDDLTRGKTACFSDYRTENGILEAHRIVEPCDGKSAVQVSELQKVSYNTALNINQFDPPPSSEKLDVAALLRDVQANQEEIMRRVSDYSYLQKITKHKFDSKGNPQKDETKVYEVYRAQGGARVFKLISENGVPLSGERLAKEEQRVSEQLIKTDENFKKDQAKRQKEQQKGNSDEENDKSSLASMLLRMKDFISPRREMFRDRETIVFNFRPKPDFHPSSIMEIFYHKTVGVMWIDPVDKQIIRLEAYFPEGIKLMGGLIGSLRSNSGFVVEQARINDGVWLPRSQESNFAFKSLFWGRDDSANTVEYSDYKRFMTEVKESKIGETPDAKQHQ